MYNRSVIKCCVWILWLQVVCVDGFHTPNPTTEKKKRCATQPTAPKKVEKVIKDCESDLKLTLIQDAFAIYRDEVVLSKHQHPENIEHHIPHHYANDDEIIYWSEPSHSKRREKRSKHIYFEDHELSLPEHKTHSNKKPEEQSWEYDYELTKDLHSTNLLAEDKWVAGCLLHCVFKKYNAVDKLGWLTLDGLVEFYTEGLDEHSYFVAVLRAVDGCLKGASHKYEIHRSIPPENGQHCDLSFDVFDCVTDKITEYCADDEKPDTKKSK